jgi:hypothetical protein
MAPQLKNFFSIITSIVYALVRLLSWVLNSIPWSTILQNFHLLRYPCGWIVPLPYVSSFWNSLIEIESSISDPVTPIPPSLWACSFFKFSHRWRQHTGFSENEHQFENRSTQIGVNDSGNIWPRKVSQNVLFLIPSDDCREKCNLCSLHHRTTTNSGISLRLNDEGHKPWYPTEILHLHQTIIHLPFFFQTIKKNNNKRTRRTSNK